jgi:hypothetical protein
VLLSLSRRLRTRTNPLRAPPSCHLDKFRRQPQTLHLSSFSPLSRRLTPPHTSLATRKNNILFTKLREGTSSRPPLTHMMALSVEVTKTRLPSSQTSVQCMALTLVQMLQARWEMLCLAMASTTQ